MPLVETRIEDDSWLSRFSVWTTELCPIEIVESAGDEPVLDLDKAGFGVSGDGAAVDTEALASALAGASTVRGSLLSTPAGMSAALAAGVSRMIARPVLPAQVLAIRSARGL
jgi:hypothetical protein